MLKEGSGFLLTVLGGLVVLVLVVFGLNYAGYLNYKFFAPKVEQVRHDTFTQSQEYNEGMQRRLYELRRQYLAATDSGSKTVLRETFLHEVDGYPNQLPADLQSFKAVLEGGQQ